MATGDLNAGIWWVGQSRGLVHDIPTCGELISRTVAEAEAMIAHLAGLRS